MGTDMCIDMCSLGRMALCTDMLANMCIDRHVSLAVADEGPAAAD